MNADKFKKIDDLNKTLENVIENVSKTIDSLDDKTQKAVDDICTRMSKEISEKLNKQRASIIKTLHQGYVSSNELIETLEPLVTMKVTDLNGAINAIKKIISLYKKPYQTAVDYVTVLTPKLVELSKNIVALGLLASELPSIPSVNYDKLQITMEPITIDDIIAG